jgi:hypothetical protein
MRTVTRAWTCLSVLAGCEAAGSRRDGHDRAVVGYGPSTHDSTSYFLIRSFPHVVARHSVEDAFYGSEEWQRGPRDAFLALIESCTSRAMSDQRGVNLNRRPAFS